jgi:hypothetical protein
VKALLVYLALGAASIVPALVTVIYAAVALLEQLAVTPDPSEAHARDAIEDDHTVPSQLARARDP